MLCACACVCISVCVHECVGTHVRTIPTTRPLPPLHHTATTPLCATSTEVAVAAAVVADTEAAYPPSLHAYRCVQAHSPARIHAKHMRGVFSATMGPIDSGSLPSLSAISVWYTAGGVTLNPFEWVSH